MEEKRSGKASSMKMVSRRSFIRGMATAGAGAAFLSSGVKTSRNGVNGMGRNGVKSLSFTNIFHAPAKICPQ